MKQVKLTLITISVMFNSCALLQTYTNFLDYEFTLADSTPTDTTLTSVTTTKTNRDHQGKPPRILSAFFGLDSDIPVIAEQIICPRAAGKDGMPVIFSHEIDVTTMQAGDFQVTKESGKIGSIHCVTLAPADDIGELRTVLLVGEYGAVDDQPVKVEIIGNLLSKDHSVNFKGKTVAPIRLEEGPTIILAEIVPNEMWELEKQSTPIRWGGGSGCPKNTKQIVRVVWTGGITKPGGGEVDDKERVQYRVNVCRNNRNSMEVIPFAIADLGDGDNNHKLCLDTMDPAVSVFFPSGFVTDPREDLNPDTKIDLRTSSALTKSSACR